MKILKKWKTSALCLLAVLLAMDSFSLGSAAEQSVTMFTYSDNGVFIASKTIVVNSVPNSLQPNEQGNNGFLISDFSQSEASHKQCVYSLDNKLLELRDPRTGINHFFYYDATGRLLEDRDTQGLTVSWAYEDTGGATRTNPSATTLHEMATPQIECPSGAARILENLDN